jgi:hypothetical protein
MFFVKSVLSVCAEANLRNCATERYTEKGPIDADPPIGNAKGRTDMNLVSFVHPDAGESGLALKKAIAAMAGLVKPTWFSDYAGFEAHLQAPVTFSTSRVYLLLMDTPERLDRLAKLIHYFEDRRTLLVLPDQTPDTISRALKFRPRYFTVQDNDFKDLCAVIKKII